ncbi:aminoacyl-tRNA synthetase class I family protein [Hyphomonas neptunium ATCC 15444]|uniref:Aminoacyl-tRNA synthetase class I family protein n=2 Tax=Hyphomonas TaxID=85 RepID=Q0BWJ1_HYPNA|nr:MULTISPECIES: tRNA glutamyl-Q(34) synthetase GluQRS [Hyphomonas]ABI77851.1 aminoacyl-tRNA synthetase class I family protein [Hyphomonas neptunium ATCC 15444]KCZ94728.1 glutamyl-Q tRNA(Asp) ligase [Hyphomonas hirschiana VP5]
MSDYITRFAPSPTGRLHLGHAVSAFNVWAAAAEAGGKVYLRIEDIDQTRCKIEFEAGILEDLAWMGLSWDGPVRRQSEHFSEYSAVLDTLRARGLIYRCFRTRREIASSLPAGADPDETGFVSRPLSPTEEAARLAHNAAFAWRLSLAAARAALGDAWRALHYTEETPIGLRRVPADPSRFGDVVLARKDTPASYHLACCHDDALQGITHVVRGEDLRAVTAIHALLQTLMGWPQPVYRFHPLLLGPDGKKLSKRNADKSLAAWRAEGMTPEDIRAMTAPA